jgi:hypothetical protein
MIEEARTQAELPEGVEAEPAAVEG